MSWPRRDEEREELVVDGGFLIEGRQQRVHLGVVIEHLEHLGVLVAEDELDRPVLPRLEARRALQVGPELRVLAGSEGGEHAPLLDQRVLDVLDAGQALQRGVELVGAQQVADRTQLVQHQLEPQLRRLVLDDEEQLVVPGRIAQRLLGRQDEVEPEVVAVGHRLPEVAADARPRATGCCRSVTRASVLWTWARLLAVESAVAAFLMTVAPLTSAAPPRRHAVDLDLEAEAEEGPDQDDQAQHDDVVQSGLDGDRADEVARRRGSPGRAGCTPPNGWRSVR